MAGLGANSNVFEGIDDPWGSENETEPQETTPATPAQARLEQCRASAQKNTASVEWRSRRMENLVLERWEEARRKGDEILQYSSMITCIPLPLHCQPDELPRGHSALWKLEARRVGGSWQVLAAGTSLEPGALVERCPLIPLERPEDDDAAICRFLSLWDPEAEWTKEWGDKLPEVRQEKLDALRLDSSQVLRDHLIVQVGNVCHYPLGYAHLYAEGASNPNAELCLSVADPPCVEIVALQPISDGEEIRLRRQPPQHLQSSPQVTHSPAEVSTPCSGYVAAGKSCLHGRGVFATASYAAGQVVELCPALILDQPAALHCADYAMSFGGNCGMCSVLALGLGALYNHASGPGTSPLDWAYDEELHCILLRTTADVEAGTELVIDYGAGYWGSRGLQPSV